VVEGFYHRLGEEFLPLLPEVRPLLRFPTNTHPLFTIICVCMTQTVPFLAELMEDSAMEVEQLCQEVIALIDKFLPEDESISTYFQ